jgi:hypothetical protein
MFRRHALLLSTIAIAASCKPEAKAPAAAPAPATPLAFTVHAKDFAFSAPDTVPAGITTITLVNDGPGIHHVQLLKLDSGKTVADFQAATKKPGPFPAWAQFASGPNAAMPGASSAATVDLSPGNYAIICLVDVPDKIPHFMKGMVRPLTVSASTAATASATAWPAADVTITATEYAFQLPDTVKAGMHTFDVKLAGVQPHEALLLKLDPGKTMADVQKWAADYKGPPPAAPMGGITVALPGTKVEFTADLTPGDYALLCFVPDAKDGKPHLMHGMVKEFKVM